MENKKELLMKLFENDDELFNATIEALDDCSGYLGDDRYYDMDYLSEFYNGVDPIELLNRAYFGRDDDSWHTNARDDKIYDSFNPNRKYFYFNGYGNLCSANYKDYSCHLDNYFIDALLENYQHLYLDDAIIDIIEED